MSYFYTIYYLGNNVTTTSITNLLTKETIHNDRCKAYLPHFTDLSTILQLFLPNTLNIIFQRVNVSINCRATDGI